MRREYYRWGEGIRNLQSNVRASETRTISNLKYDSLKKVVKACLCFFHGSADVAREFSADKQIFFAH